MTLVAADGTNFETANAYCDRAYADAYHSLRGNTAWTGSDSAKEAAIIRATDYIEQIYGARWIGSIDRVTGLSWPRYYASLYATDAIPELLKKATAELALEALSGDLNPALSADAAVKREKVDVIETEYFEPARTVKARPAVSGLLASLLGGSSFNVPVVRV